MRISLLSVMTALLIGIWSTAGTAAPIVATFNFSGTDFVYTYFGSTPSPVSAVSGSVTISFTPGVYSVSFVDPAAPAIQSFQIQGLPTPLTAAVASYQQGYGPIQGNGDVFAFLFNSPGQRSNLDVTFASARPIASGGLTGFAAPVINYQGDAPITHDNFQAQQTSGTVFQANTAVPEPATLILLGTAIVGAAALRRRPR